MAKQLKKCHSGPCGPCKLCKKQSSKYTHTEKLSDDEYKYLCGLEQEQVSKNACISFIHMLSMFKTTKEKCGK